MAALITLLYARYLGAVASIDDLVTWLDAARTNGWSAGQLRAAFLGSAASDSSVAAAYRAILHRGPESAAVVTQWRTGRTIGQVWDGLAAAYAAGSR